MQRAFGICVLLLALVLPASLAFAADEKQPSSAEIADLEERRDAKPKKFRVRMDLGDAYWKRARLALDERAYGPWHDDVSRAIDEWLAALSIDRDHPDPHLRMAIAALYQGELERALQNLGNARRLDPRNGTHYANIAQALIYNGNMTGAARYILRAEDLRADPVHVMFDRAFVDWYYGRLEDAQWHYSEAVRIDPNVARVFDLAPVAEPLETFGDFARYCCASVGCGPYMAHACRDIDAQVAEIELPEEIARRQLVKEMERRRRIARIYGIRNRGRDDPLSENAGDARIEIDPAETPSQQDRRVTIEIEEDEAEGEEKPESEEAPVGSGGFKGGPL